jgi:hypothetical protein
VFVGQNAGFFATGSNNTSLGTDTGPNGNGTNNVFLGTDAGTNTTSGSNNTFVGYQAGRANGSGSNLTLVGAGAGAFAKDLVNATAIGAGAMVSASNSVVIGSPTDTISVPGRLTKAAGSFKIDHPLDPANKTLSHSFVESPDMMNVYNGNIMTNARGEAVVVLPDWFEALNQDFRYQLTVIGQFAQAIVAKKIQHNRFTIKTNKPKIEVSWQVTGIRHDAYAIDHRIPIEEDKPIT